MAGSASRTVTLNADEVTFGISLTAGAGTTLDQAVTMLKDTGVNGNDLINISSYRYYLRVSDDPAPTRIKYDFNIVKPFAEMRSIIEKLETAREAVIANEGDLEFALDVGASEASVEQMRQKLFPELLAEARKNAEFLARMSQMTLGAIQTVSDGNYIGGVSPMAAGYGGYGSLGRVHLIRVTFSVYARWAARAQ